MTRIAFRWLLAASLFGPIITAQRHPRPAGETAAWSADPVFTPVLDALRKQCGLAPRLPAKLPDLGQGKDPLYALLDRVSREEYRIYLSFTPECNGGSVCRLGTLTGKKATDVKERGGTVVRLANGLKGSYTESECGASCSDSVIRWREGDTEYSSGVKAGSRDDALRLANSCLRH